MNIEMLSPEDNGPCAHRYLTSHGKGWVCANRTCGVGILSLGVPIPMPLVEEALRAIGASIPPPHTKELT